MVKLKIPKNLEDLPDEHFEDWEPQVVEQKLIIKKKEGLYNSLNEMVRLYPNGIPTEFVADLVEKHFKFTGG